MGEAKRRKLQGSYPDGSTPKPTEERSTPGMRAEPKVCANCTRGGGTLAIRDGALVHIPDCDHAAAARMRGADRHERALQRRWQQMLRARRWPQAEPAKRATDEEPKE